MWCFDVFELIFVYVEFYTRHDRAEDSLHISTETLNINNLLNYFRSCVLGNYLDLIA